MARALSTRAQLDLITEVAGILDEDGIASWLSGGWAVDFHAGRVRRPHSDIDLVINLADKPRFWRVLERLDFVIGPVHDGRGVQWFDRQGLRLEISYLTENSDGVFVTPGYEFWPWPEDSFSGAPLTLEGVTIRVVSVGGLLDMKRRWEENVGEAPRPHDLADVETLEGLVATS